VAEWNQNLSLWKHYQVKRNAFKVYYLKGFRNWLLMALRKYTGKYFYTLDTFMFAIQSWTAAKKLHIDMVQTTDAQVVFVFNLLSKIYKPKIIFDVHHYPSRWLRNLNSIDLIVCNASGYRDDLLARGAQSSKILVLPNGYDPSMFLRPKIFHRDEFGIKKSDFVVGFIGRFETFGEEKGIKQLLQAISMIGSSIPIKVLLVGEPKALAKEYHQLANELKIEKKIIIKPFVSPSEVAGIMNLFDLGWLVYPNTPRFRNHISPMKAIEYAAAKLPMLASNIPSIKNIFNESQAFFVEDNSNSIARSLVGIYHDTQRRLTVSKNAFNKIKEYSWINRQKEILQKVEL
jgi:glycosyltransferase involved in cell wall biosynthesis